MVLTWFHEEMMLMNKSEGADGRGNITRGARNKCERNSGCLRPQPLLMASPEICVDIILKFRASTCMNMNLHAEFLHASVKWQKEPNRPYSCIKAMCRARPENKPSMLD